MRKPALLLMVTLLAGALLASAGGDPQNNEASAGQENKPEKSLEAEKYYQLLLERQRLMISSYEQTLKILEAHNNDPMAARENLKKHEAERDKKMQELFQRYEVSPSDYYHSVRGTEVLEQRSKYLDSHPEVRDELAANSTRMRELEKEIRRRMNALWTKEYKSAP